jgi:hypothetical protein
VGLVTLVHRLDRAADRRIHRALHPAWCDQCGRPIRGRATLRLRIVGPSQIARVEIHRRCPIRLTSRARRIAELAGAAIGAAGFIAFVVTLWALAAPTP